MCIFGTVLYRELHGLVCCLCLCNQFWRITNTGSYNDGAFFKAATLPTPLYQGPVTSGAVGNSGRQQRSDEMYMERLTGFFVPPYNATYTFYFASDDWGDFSLSTNSSPSGLRVVASIANWADYSSPYTRSPNTQITTPFALIGGAKYFMRMRHGEGGGEDWMRLAVRITGAPDSGE